MKIFIGVRCPDANNINTTLRINLVFGAQSLGYGLDDRRSIPSRDSAVFFLFATASRPGSGGSFLGGKGPGA
jgi:hypothetical protein